MSSVFCCLPGAAGAVFPPRSERSAPVMTPPQSHPLSSYAQNARNSASNHEDAGAESSAEDEYPSLRCCGSFLNLASCTMVLSCNRMLKNAGLNCYAISQTLEPPRT